MVLSQSNCIYCERNIFLVLLLASNTFFHWLSLTLAQWFIRWVGGEDQAQIESYIEIY